MIQPTTELLQSLESKLTNDLLAFLPECILISGIALGLFLRLFDSLRRFHLVYFTLFASGLSLALAVGQWQKVPSLTPTLENHNVFTGLLKFDEFSLFLRVFLLGFLTLLLWLNLLTGIPDRDDAADYSTLLMGSTLGMILMVSSNHLMMLFIAVEMASVPSYALSGFLKGRRQGSEAALKYVVYGAAASGVMLYGISLLVARFGSGAYPDLTHGLSVALSYGQVDLMLMVGLLFVLVGLAFKLSLVPFHFWVPDVFSGAAAEVGAFLSVASKGAAMGLTARFLVEITGGSSLTGGSRVSIVLGAGLALFGIVTATFGNLAAMGQTNLKRLLAYSTIAHAGYMLLGLATLSLVGVSSVLFYLVAYLGMNLGAFAVVALLRNRLGSEDLGAMSGAIRHSPVLVVTLSLFLLSLLGIPPLMGFAAKFQIFAVLFDSANHVSTDLPGLQTILFGILVLAGINTVISAGYYLKVLRVLILDSPSDTAPMPRTESVGQKCYTLLLALGIFVGGVLWSPVQIAADRAADSLTSQKSR